jgi:subtilase family serine protease
VGTTPPASDTTIAIFAEGDLTQVLLDLRQAEAEHHQTVVPYTVVQIGAQSGDTSGADEFDLDTQTSSGLAENVKEMVIYDTTSLNDVDLIPSFNQFVIDNNAQAGSASFGGCELTEMTSGAIPTYDQIFRKAFVQGQTVFASAGDDGAACPEAASTGVPDTGVVSGQSYPCSSPYVMCVGGTTLTTDAEANYITEIAWIATGGGTSEVEPPEFWQYGIVPTSSVSAPATPATGALTLPLYKGVPDLAMDADNNLSPAVVVVNGADTGVGGTSLSSPLALGAWARFQTSHCNSLGNAAPVLYAFAVGTDATTGTVASIGGGMHDIVVGENGLYPALPGWDYVSGVGTFDITAVNAALPKVTCNTTSTGGTTGTSSGGTTGSMGTGSGSTGTGSSSTGSSSATGSASTSSSSDSRLAGGGPVAPISLVVLGLAASLRRRRRSIG